MDRSSPADAFIADEILRQVRARGPDRSICPSEVARALAAEWHPLMGAVRRVAVVLARSGQVDILRKGRPVDPDGFKGVIRLREHKPNG